MSYAEAWREDRRLWKRFLLWWIGGPVVFAGLSFLVSVVGSLFLSPSTVEAMMGGVFFLVAVMWVMGTLITGGQLFFGFRCPRCDNLFYRKGLGGNAYAHGCRHCGLRKGEMEPPEGVEDGSRD